MDANKNVTKKSPFIFSFDYKVHVQLSPFTLLMPQPTVKIIIIIQHLHTEEVRLLLVPPIQACCTFGRNT